MAHKHTPGPWKVSRFNGCRVLHSGSNAEIALCEQPADARLAAYAPMMADFCRYLAAADDVDFAGAAKMAGEIAAKIDSAH